MSLCVLSLKALVLPTVSYSPVVEPVLPQLSPGVSTVRMEAAYPGVCFTTFYTWWYSGRFGTFQTQLLTLISGSGIFNGLLLLRSTRDLVSLETLACVGELEWVPPVLLSRTRKPSTEAAAVNVDIVKYMFMEID